MGAQEVIQRLGRDGSVPVEAKQDAGTAAAETLARDLCEFKTVRATMTADEAAGRWLGLYDRFWLLPPAAVMKAIEYRPALKSLVLARPAGGGGPAEILLRLVVSYLTRDQAGLTRGIAELTSSASGSGLPNARAKALI